MLDLIKKLFGTKQERDVKSYMPLVDEINEIYESLATLSNDDLRLKTEEFRNRVSEHLKGINADIAELKEIADKEEDLFVREERYRELDELIEERDEHLEDILQELLPEAFAVVKETAKRFTDGDLEVTATPHDRDIAAQNNYVEIKGDKAIYRNQWTAAGGEVIWDMIHYDVQLIGGMVLHDGKIAEMATGEGKTLVATLPAYLNGLAGLGVHIVTVNDYLAQRDAEWVGPIFEFLMLTVDCIDKYKPHSEERRRAYRCDVTYGTNNEFGFDYLRDNMVRSEEERVQRKQHFAMVDEVDSVFIDDARTPLIISGPVPKGSEEQEYETLNPRIQSLIKTQKELARNYLIEAKSLISEGSTGYKEGEGGMALLRAFRAMPKNRALIKFLSEEGNKVVLQKAENYYMQEQSKHMHVVDEPLYFTIEEKTRNVELLEKGAEILAKGSEDASMFIMPEIGTELQELESNEELSEKDKTERKQEIIEDYAIKSRRLHATSQLLKAYSLFERDVDYIIKDNQVKIVDEQTGRVMEGRRYSEGLHQALEAKENVKVGELTQTYATVTLQNFFRMYHKLAGMTGTAETEASEFWEIYKLDVVVVPTNRPIVRDDKEDLVFKTANEKFNAVIEEIENLTGNGRPVLVGTTSVDVSEKLSRMLQLRKLGHNVLNAKQHQREAEIVAEAGKPGKVTIATNMAGRGTDIKISKEVKDAGGLAIIGTERHNSRRVDRQLRGRAGRQGDPGSSQFYVSLEDDLMRLFHSERIAKLMDKMGHKEGDVIQHSMITKSIERAQKRLEENNFGIRKRLLEYDDVMNIQREAIYQKRTNALTGERLKVDINNMFAGLTEAMVYDHTAGGDYESFRADAISSLGIDPEVSKEEWEKENEDVLVERLQKQAWENYERKSEEFRTALLPIIERIYDNEGHRYKRIAVPFVSTASKPLPVAANLERAVESEGKTIMDDIEKNITLALIDEHWKDHLRAMDELKDSVQAASFEQKDPLVVYKMEAFKLFESLIYKINRAVISYLFEGKMVLKTGESLREAKKQKTDLSKTRTSRMSDEEAAHKAAGRAGRSQQKVETVVRDQPKIKRNDPCPCGSGRKYKHCHGKVTA